MREEEEEEGEERVCVEGSRFWGKNLPMHRRDAPRKLGRGVENGLRQEQKAGCPPCSVPGVGVGVGVAAQTAQNRPHTEGGA